MPGDVARDGDLGSRRYPRRAASIAAMMDMGKIDVAAIEAARRG